ncbi:GTP pyrophosphokinase [Ligilactobacillus sp. WILCCON 0076]|uniref:GTP pyrophosphokinase n=1 Tax=Ligilactobacillus ubinensis TaxID=2876789 RepID=A0A9X2FSK3_9LACO|nr:HD domain-containing protein [Ligilactobacillus ubinensis]MCP0887913.1 GTP pyrophosphokinase [Ligilactobacillus ubinensis]
MDNEESFTEKALGVAMKYHEGQLDLGGSPYINHLITVGELVKKGNDLNTDEVVAIAYLHDILEDTECREVDLYNLFSKGIVEAVIDLTRKHDETYQEYLERLKPNELARIVKLADLSNNQDISRISNPTKRDFDRRKKYLKAISFLRSEE